MTPPRTSPARPALRAASLALALLAGQAAAASPTKACRIDRAAYTSLKVGMSEAKVRRRIGCAGRRISHLTIGRVHRTTSTWPARGSFGANVTLTFRDHRLTDKTQLGLR